MNLWAVSSAEKSAFKRIATGRDIHTISRHFVVGTNLVPWSAILGATVWVLGRVWLSALVIWVERAAGSITRDTGNQSISPLHLCWISADHLGNEWEGRSLGSH